MRKGPLLLLLVLAVLPMVVSAGVLENFWNILVGKAVSPTSNHIGETDPGDWGSSYPGTIWGECYDETGTYTESCVDSNILMEYSLQNNKCVLHRINCSVYPTQGLKLKGYCLDGACKSWFGDAERPMVEPIENVPCTKISPSSILSSDIFFVLNDNFEFYVCTIYGPYASGERYRYLWKHWQNDEVNAYYSTVKYPNSTKEIALKNINNAMTIFKPNYAYRFDEIAYGPICDDNGETIERNNQQITCINGRWKLGGLPPTVQIGETDPGDWGWTQPGTVKGVCYDETGTYTDYCINSKVLVEYVLQGQRCVAHRMNCSAYQSQGLHLRGVCINGARKYLMGDADRPMVKLIDHSPCNISTYDPGVWFALNDNFEFFRCGMIGPGLLWSPWKNDDVVAVIAAYTDSTKRENGLKNIKDARALFKPNYAYMIDEIVNGPICDNNGETIERNNQQITCINGRWKLGGLPESLTTIRSSTTSRETTSTRRSTTSTVSPISSTTARTTIPASTTTVRGSVTTTTVLTSTSTTLPSPQCEDLTCEVAMRQYKDIAKHYDSTFRLTNFILEKDEEYQAIEDWQLGKITQDLVCGIVNLYEKGCSLITCYDRDGMDIFTRGATLVGFNYDSDKCLETEDATTFSDYGPFVSETYCDGVVSKRMVIRCPSICGLGACVGTTTTASASTTTIRTSVSTTTVPEWASTTTVFGSTSTTTVLGSTSTTILQRPQCEDWTCEEALAQSGDLGPQYDSGIAKDAIIESDEELSAIDDWTRGRMTLNQVCGIVNLFEKRCVVSTCWDNDGGLNYYLVGNTKIGGWYNRDKCLEAEDSALFSDYGSFVSETYCDGDTSSRTIFRCPGQCVLGACVNETCISDGQYGSYAAGDTCCRGLTAATSVHTEEGCTQLETDSFLCIHCGDEICGQGESICNCNSDCETCIAEGESGNNVIRDVCCGSLQQISNSQPTGGSCSEPSDSDFICANCGDGNCGSGENECNCPEDCLNRNSCVGEGYQKNPGLECCPGLDLIPPISPNNADAEGICTALCGNGICDANTESSHNCPIDCEPENNCTGMGGYCIYLGEECRDGYQSAGVMDCPQDSFIDCCRPLSTIPSNECTGCLQENGTCLPIGSIIKKGGISFYCSSNQQIVKAAADNRACANNYECQSDICRNGKCINKGLFLRLLLWVRGLFGG